MRKHDPYLTELIETVGLTQTIVNLQHMGARRSATARRLRGSTIDFLSRHSAETSEWAYRQARILMGVD